jgi:hypothetical protein
MQAQMQQRIEAQTLSKSFLDVLCMYGLWISLTGILSNDDDRFALSDSTMLAKEKVNEVNNALSVYLSIICPSMGSLTGRYRRQLGSHCLHKQQWRQFPL